MFRYFKSQKSLNDLIASHEKTIALITEQNRLLQNIYGLYVNLWEGSKKENEQLKHIIMFGQPIFTVENKETKH